MCLQTIIKKYHVNIMALGSSLVTTAADQAAKAAADQAAKAAADQAAKAAADQASKAAADQASKAAADQASKAAADQASKAAADQASKAAADQAAKTAADQAAKDAAEQAAKKASKLSPADLATYGALAAGTAYGVYTYATASQAADASNSTPRGITKIEYSSSSSKSIVQITFTPAMRILLGDDLTFRGTKTTPVIDGAATVKTVTSNSKIEVDFGTLQITDLTPGGFIDVKTTVGAQAAASVADAGADLGNAGGGFLDGIMPDWFKNMGSSLKTGLTIFCVVIIIAILGYLAYTFLVKDK